jgi:hypothetical protein
MRWAEIRSVARATITRTADSCTKYGEPFHYTVGDGTLLGNGGVVLVFEVAPRKAFGFGKGDRFSQTRWRF